MRVDSVSLRRRSDRLWLLGAALLALLLLVNAWREPISERLLPDPRLNRKLEDAQKALARGELSRADGRGAKELLESVLAIDPDRAEARQGLEAVRNAALARAAKALDARRLADAARDLDLARALSAPLVQLQPLQARLSKLEEASVDVDGLLARAAAPDVGDEEALALLDQVLALDASNALALEGRRELFAAWLLETEQLLDAGQVERARAIIERVLAEDPAHVDLPPLRARLAEIDAGRPPGRRGTGADAAVHPTLAPAQSQSQRRGRECFAQAMATGKLRRAEACLEQWMAPDPAAEGIAEARRQLAERWLAYADERIGASDWDEATQALAAAGRWQPDHAQLPVARARLARARGNARKRSRRVCSQGRRVERTDSGEKCRRVFSKPPRRRRSHSSSSRHRRAMPSATSSADSASHTSSPWTSCIPSAAHPVATTGRPRASAWLTLPLTPAP
jgi:hypothetical protein